MSALYRSVEDDSEYPSTVSRMEINAVAIISSTKENPCCNRVRNGLREVEGRKHGRRDMLLIIAGGGTSGKNGHGSFCGQASTWVREVANPRTNSAPYVTESPTRQLCDPRPIGPLFREAPSGWPRSRRPGRTCPPAPSAEHAIRNLGETACP